MPKVKTKEIKIEIKYFSSKNSIPASKIFCGGILIPDLQNLDIAVDNYEYLESNDQNNSSIIFDKQAITILGSKKSLYELGKFIIGVSTFETTEPDFHEHIELKRNSTEQFVKELTVKRLDIFN